MAEQKKILFIINPISGVGKKNTVPPLIEKHLNADLFKWEIRYTKKRSHGAEIAAEERTNFDAIIAVGGDGSVNEIGSALVGHNCALGIIPCGSGNGIARHLRIPLKIEDALKRIADFSVSLMDTGLVNKLPFIGTCGFGFDAHIAEKFDSFGKRGFFSYARLVVREFNKYQSPVFKIKGKNIDIEKNAIMCSIANSSQFGNGFTISPNSDIQDGIFELVFLERFSTLEAPFITKKFFSKSIHKSKHFSSISFSDQISITVNSEKDLYYHIDGEPIKGKGCFTVTILPKSLHII